MLTVVVPDGLEAGDEFVVCADGHEFAVTVPEGVAGNVAIEVDVPVSDSEIGDYASDLKGAPVGGNVAERVEITVPDGVLAGEPFNVESPWGGLFEVVAPAGVVAGDTLEIELPCAPVPCEGSAAASSPATAASSAYEVGERVQAQRTDGSWSVAEVLEYDDVSDTYTVRLATTGQLKYLLTESELQPLEFQADRCGDHFVGRRVQVPTIGANTRDEVMGEIRAFDPVNRTYDILMDTGLFKRGVQAEAIRVREKVKPPPAFRGPSLAMSRLGL